MGSMIDEIFGFLRSQGIVQNCSMPTRVVFSGFYLLSGCDRLMNEAQNPLKNQGILVYHQWFRGFKHGFSGSIS